MIEDLVSRFGYLAVFLGTFIEGETFILMGGFFAHQGYLGFTSTVSVAAFGAFSGDLFYFFFGRRHGRELIQRSRRAREMVPWLERFMDRHHILWIFGVRYLYGVRWLAAALAGSSRLSPLRFVTVALPACFLWALVIAGFGYAVGTAMARILGDVERYELYFLLAAVLVGVIYGVTARFWRRDRSSE